MAEPQKTEYCIPDKLVVPWYGYVALIFAIVVFSGVMAKQAQWLTVFDFNTINGNFGVMKDAKTIQGQGGMGARDGFMFALTLIPSVMLALGFVEVIDHLGGLKAGQKLLTPILRPLLGLPGITGLALVTSIQSTDAGAGMTKMLRETDCINEKERTIFSAWQFSGGGTITNYFASGAAAFAIITVPIAVPLVVIFVLKCFGSTLMRLYLRYLVKEV